MYTQHSINIQMDVFKRKQMLSKYFKSTTKTNSRASTYTLQQPANFLSVFSTRYSFMFYDDHFCLCIITLAGFVTVAEVMV